MSWLLVSGKVFWLLVSGILYLNVWWITLCSTWYIVVDHPCAELFFWSLPPNLTALSEKGSLSLSVYLNPRDNHISIYRTKIHWAVAKLAHFFTLSIPHFQLLHFIGALTTMTSYYSHSSTNFLYVVYESNWLENAQKWEDYRKNIWRIWI